MKTDAFFYQIFKEFPATYFDVIGVPAETAKGYTFASQELKQSSLRIDGVLIPAVVDDPVHFVEVFFYKTPHAYSNLFAKVFLWLETTDPARDWHACAIFESRRLEPDNTAPYRVLLESRHVTRVYLDELPEPREDQLGLGILKMMVSPRSQVTDKARELLKRVNRLKQPVAQLRKLVELVEIAVLGHFPKLSRKELETMLQIKDFRETRVYKEALEKGMEKGMEKEREEIALRLLAENLSVAKVAELTSMTVPRVRTLKRKIGKA